jgi:hypothetical protein
MELMATTSMVTLEALEALYAMLHKQQYGAPQHLAHTPTRTGTLVEPTEPADAESPLMITSAPQLRIVFKGKIPKLSGRREHDGAGVETALPKQSDASDSHGGFVPMVTDPLPTRTSGTPSHKHASMDLPIQPVNLVKEKRVLGLSFKGLKGPRGIARKREEDEGSDAGIEAAPPRKRTKLDDPVSTSCIAARKLFE